ncbi:unnamed protein product [Tilletia controversa]|nr:unnamed protein product [Tilletia controversa]
MDLSAAFEKALEHIAADAAAKKQSDWFYEPESFLVPVDNDDSFDLSLPIILTEEEQVALAVTTIGDAVRAVVSADSLDMSVDSDVARDVIPAAATTDDGLIDDMSLMGLALDSFLGLLLAEREKDELANAAQIDNEVAMLIDTSLESLLDFPVFADEEEIEVTKAAAADEFTTLLIDTSIDSLLNFALVPDHETDVLQATLKSLVIPTIVLTAPDFPGSTSISSSVDTDFLCVPAIMSQRASRRLAHQASQDDLELMFAFLDDEKTELLTDMSLNDLVVISINGLAASSTAQFPVRALGRRSKDMAAILLADLQKDVDELDEDEEEEQGLLADVHLPDPIRPHDAPVSAAKARFDVEKSKKELCMAALAFFDDLHAVRAHLRTVWDDYGMKKVDLVTAAVTTNSALELFHRPHDELMKDMPTGKSEPIRDLVHYARVEDSVTQTLYDKFFIPAYMCLGTISMLIGGSRNVLSYPNDRNGYDDTLDVPRCTTQERWKQLEGLLTKSYSGYAAVLMQGTRKEKKKNVTFELDCMARSMRQY